ncbi:tetratricopeptide repeat domain-containing protein [Ceratobasidium sp. AG-Ba]|nr:tetratricopeptide repeat domain-containing protein [Ceratobasidium sp. AG-Ba]QRW02365.1 tetratricopeptide repeat domain-containing protein [Ceratobasidium sp. AG-Ba]
MSDYQPLLHDIEWSLIEGKWRGSLDALDLDALPVVKLVKLVVDGEFKQALSSHLAKQILTLGHSGQIFTLEGKFNGRLETYCGLKVDVDGTDADLARLAVAVACLHSYIQLNWTGPDLDLDPLSILTLPTPPSKPLTTEILNTQAVGELAYNGEPAYHLSQHPVLLRLAQMILARGFDQDGGLISGPWWNLRTHLVHQRVLDEAVPVPDHFWLSLSSVELAVEGDLAGRLSIEKGLLRHLFAHDRLASDLFIEAAQKTGLRYEITGALGKRTKFQTRDLTQLVLLAKSREEVDAEGGKEDGAKVPETMALNDDTLLEQTEYATGGGGKGDLKDIDPAKQPALRPIDQCIFLGMCLNVRNTSPAHGLTSEQMMPYIARVIAHPRNWSVHTMALLLRARLESTRTRTVERSVLQLQALVDQMPTADSSLSERLLFFHSIPLPSKWAMESELAHRYLSIGVVKSALEIFERLEMWEEVVRCYQSIEQRDRALKIVQDLLEGRKAEVDIVLARGRGRTQAIDVARESKLWCLLGELDPANALGHYKHAWELSGGTSARAARALGGYLFTRGEYAECIPHLQKATTLQPLNSRSWFLLGCACVRQESWIEARDAFARCVSIDQEDGESWNNIASVYMRMDEKGLTGGPDLTVEDQDEDSVPAPITVSEIKFTNKILAFRALKQGLKYSYENWRMWQNYVIVAVDSGELSEACRALGRLVELRSGKEGSASVDIEVLERLVDAVTRAPPDEDEPDANQQRVRNADEGHGLFPGVYDLFSRVILPRVSDSPRIYRAWARLLMWRARSKTATHLRATWTDALNAHMDAYRSGVVEIEEMVDVMRNLGPRAQEEDAEGKKGGTWQFQAKSLVRTFMGRTKASFGDEPEWEKLQDLLNELKNE